MLIELRSSPVDPNNTASSLMTPFLETLIVKPNTKISLVSALITTKNEQAIVIQAGVNDTLELQIGSLPTAIITIPPGTYSGSTLSNALTTAMRLTITGLPDIVGDFYPADHNNDWSWDSGKLELSVAVGYVAYNKPLTQFANGTAEGTILAENGLLSVLGTHGAVLTKNGYNFVANGGAGAPDYGLGTARGDQRTSITQLTAAPLFPYSQGGGTGGGDPAGCFEIGRLLMNQQGVYQCHLTENIQSRNPDYGYDWSFGDTNGTAAPGWFEPAAGAPATQARWNWMGGDSPLRNGYDYQIAVTDAFGTFTGFYYAKEKGRTNEVYVNITDKGTNDIATTYDFLGVYLPDPTGAGEYHLPFTPNPAAPGVPFIMASNVGALPISGHTLTASFEPAVAGTHGEIHISENGRELTNPAGRPQFTNATGFRWVVPSLDVGFAETHKPWAETRAPGQTAWTRIPLAIPITHQITEDERLYPSLEADYQMPVRGAGENTGDPVESGTPGAVLLSAGTSGGAITAAMTAIGGGAFSNGVANDLCYAESTSGAGRGMTMIFKPNVVNGAVLTPADLFQGWAGNGYVDNEVVKFVSLQNPSVQFNLNLGTLVQQANRIVVGSLYPGNTDLATTGGNGTGLRIQTGAVTGGGNVGNNYVITDPGEGYLVGDQVTLVGGNNDCVIEILQTSWGQLQLAAVNTSVVNNITYPPMLPQNRQNLNMGTANSILNFNPPSIRSSPDDHLSATSGTIIPTETNNETILVQAEDFPIDSRNGAGRSDNHIAVLPYQTDINDFKESHKQFIQPYNLIYHKTKNTEPVNLNHMRVRLTDFQGVERTDLQHPTELTIHLDPDYM